MLRLHGQRHRLVLTEIGRLPRAAEDIEPELLTDGLLDHIAVAPTEPSRAHPHCAQNVLINSQRRPHLRHLRIITSLHQILAHGKVTGRTVSAR